MLTQPTEFSSIILNALTKRNFVFEKATNNIAKKIDFVFEAIIEYLNQNAHEVVWDDIDTTNGLLVVSAKLAVPDGSQHKVLTVGIPMNIVELQSKQEIINFFLQSEKSQVEKNARQQLKQELYGRYNSTTNLPDDPVDEFDEFNDNVTEDNTIPIKHTLH
jgi:hypothetical protein